MAKIIDNVTLMSEVVQSIGSSTTSVMSQDAITRELNALKGQNELVGTLPVYTSYTSDNIQTILSNFVYETLTRDARNGDLVNIKFGIYKDEQWRYDNNQSAWSHYIYLELPIGSLSSNSSTELAVPSTPESFGTNISLHKIAKTGKAEDVSFTSSVTALYDCTEVKGAIETVLSHVPVISLNGVTKAFPRLDYSFYAPTDGGAIGTILKSNGPFSTPTFTQLYSSDVSCGDKTLDLKLQDILNNVGDYKNYPFYSGNEEFIVSTQRSVDFTVAWVVNNYQATLQKTSDIITNKTSIELYPNTFAVYDLVAPHDVYRTDGSTGLYGINKEEVEFEDTMWQLTGLNLSEYKRLKFYIKNNSSDTGVGGVRSTPPVIIEMSLETPMLTFSGHYVAQAVGYNMNDRNVHFRATAMVSSDKTKAVILDESSLYGTTIGGRNDNGRYCWLIEGYKI